MAGRQRAHAGGDGDEPGWRDHAAAVDAVRIGAALTGHPRQPEARIWLLAAAQVAPPRMLAAIGGSLVDAAAVTEAEEALRRGAEAGDADACLQLGRLLLVDGREEEAGRWLRAAMEADPQKAHVLVGDLRHRGAGRVADRWAAVAAEIGDAWSAVNLAWSASRRVTARPERWLELAGQLGYEGLPMERLGMAMERGDEAAIRRWLAVAAEEGHPAAQFGLGMAKLNDGDETAG